MQEITQNLQKYILLVRISRPLTWIYFWCSYLGGLLITRSEIRLEHIVTGLVVGPALGLILYGINDIFDGHIQDVTLPFFHIPHLHLSHVVGILSTCASIILLFLPLYFNNPFGFCMVMIGLFFGYGYSLPPLSLKKYPGFDVLVNTIGYLILVLLGMSYTITPLLIIDSRRVLILSSILILVWSLFSFNLENKNHHAHERKKLFSKKYSMFISAVGYSVISLGVYFFAEIQPFNILGSILLLCCSLLLMLGITNPYNFSLPLLFFIITCITLLTLIGLYSPYLSINIFDLVNIQ